MVEQNITVRYPRKGNSQLELFRCKIRNLSLLVTFASTHYCCIVAGREYHLWSYNFFSSHLVKWCFIIIYIYIYIMQYDICIYLYIFIYTISYYVDFFHPQVIFFWTVLGVRDPWAFPGHHAFTNAMTAAQIVERRHKEGKTKLYLGVSSRSLTVRLLKKKLPFSPGVKI